jgi:hypothetical protein
MEINAYAYTIELILLPVGARHANWMHHARNFVCAVATTEVTPGSK